MSERVSRGSDRYRYGYCINPDCKLRGRQNVQKKSTRSNFDCEECHHDLQECARPRSFMEKYGKVIYAAIGVIAILAIIWLVISIPKNESEVKENHNETPVDSISVIETEPSIEAEAASDTVVTIKTDTVIVEKEVIREVPASVPSTPRAANPTISNGALSLSYGKYIGDIKNGYPDGMGRLTYSSNRVINKYDTKKRTANPGDYVIGEFVRGFLVQGKLYDQNGNLIEALIIGSPVSNTYEQK